MPKGRAKPIIDISIFNLCVSEYLKHIRDLENQNISNTILPSISFNKVRANPLDMKLAKKTHA